MPIYSTHLSASLEIEVTGSIDVKGNVESSGHLSGSFLKIAGWSVGSPIPPHIQLYTNEVSVVAGRPLGGITWYANDNNGPGVGAVIAATASADWSNNNTRGTDLKIYTQTAGNTEGLTYPRMTISASGDVGVEAFTIYGTGSTRSLEVGTPSNPSATDYDKFFPLRVASNDGDAFILLDVDASKQSGFAATYDSTMGKRQGLFVDWAENNHSRWSFREFTGAQQEGAIVIRDPETNPTAKSVRIGGGGYKDTYDTDASLLITSSLKSRPSLLRIRSHHGAQTITGYPALSWQHELQSSTVNAGHWVAAVAAVGPKSLRIGSPSPGNSNLDRNYSAVTFAEGGVTTRVGVGGENGTFVPGDGSVRSLIPTGTFHTENQRTTNFSLDWELDKAQLLVGNSGGSGNRWTGVAMDSSTESNLEAWTGHMGFIATGSAAGHCGLFTLGVYDGSGNTKSTRQRVMVNASGSFHIFRGTNMHGTPNSSWPQTDPGGWDISKNDIPTGSLVIVSLDRGAEHGKDPATIDLVTWTGNTMAQGAVTTGQNLGRINWWSADSQFNGNTGDSQYANKSSAAYIEAVAPMNHDTTNYATADLNFYTRRPTNADLTIGFSVDHVGNTHTWNNNFIDGTLNVSGTSEFNASMLVKGTAPTIVIGDGGNEDAGIKFDGDTNDYHIGFDATSDSLMLGNGATIGGNPAIQITSGSHVGILGGLYQSPACSPTKDRTSNGSNVWVKILEADSRFSLDQTTGVFLLTFTGTDYGGASYEYDLSMIVSARYAPNGGTMDQDGTSISVELIQSGIRGASVTQFDPTTDIAIVDDGGSSKVEVWAKSPAVNKQVFVTHLGGSSNNPAYISSRLDSSWTVSNDGVWQAAAPNLGGTTKYGVTIDKVFNQATADKFLANKISSNPSTGGNQVFQLSGSYITSTYNAGQPIPTLELRSSGTGTWPNLALTSLDTSGADASEIQFRHRDNMDPGENLGEIKFQGATTDADNWGTATSIIGESDTGTWADGSSNPGRLLFYTTADGATAGTERMRIAADGLVTLSGVLQVGGNDIKDSGGNIALSFDGSGNIDSIGPITQATLNVQDIQLNGNDIKDSGGNTLLSGNGTGYIDSDLDIIGTTYSIYNLSRTGNGTGEPSWVIHNHIGTNTYDENDDIGQIQFRGSTSAFGSSATGLGVGGANIHVEAQQSWSNASYGSKFIIQTTTNGAVFPSNAMRITGAGNVILDGTLTENGAPFTRGHRYSSDEALDIGDTVVLVGDKLQKSTSAMQKNVAGIIHHNEADFVREYGMVLHNQQGDDQVGTASSTIQDSWDNAIPLGVYNSETEQWEISAELEKLWKVASIGDSRQDSMLGFKVCNEGGQVGAGDLLCTSNTTGYLMKQPDDIIRSHTVGKAMVDVAFDGNGQAVGVYGYIYCG